jgi:hypothetical protein
MFFYDIVQKTFFDSFINLRLRKEVTVIEDVNLPNHIGFKALVDVDRTLKPHQVIKATNRILVYEQEESVNSMPCGTGGKAEVFFFIIFGYLSGLATNFQVQQEYKLRGLKPDPYALAAVYQDNPHFAPGYGSATQWQDAHGVWHSMMLYREEGHRLISIHPYCNPWSISWWFAGVQE